MAQPGGGLNPRQRAHLKSLAHPLRPIAQVGKGGVDEDVARSLADAFQNRELLKVKVLESAPTSAKETAEQLGVRVSGAKVVQVIGRTIVLYRQHPDRPEIRLPT
ncbi:MAG TPA: ribosome assembly RNA-binding protein YhbY [Longimicrobiales bacterium]|nr:ribosome assembly RNA-binding protein YhbY [Longimicrobiales bacterium]